MRNKEISRKSLKLNRKEEMKFLIICQSKMTLSHFRKRVSIFGGQRNQNIGKHYFLIKKVLS